jgi:hypothetical protein
MHLCLCNFIKLFIYEQVTVTAACVIAMKSQTLVEKAADF